MRPELRISEDAEAVAHAGADLFATIARDAIVDHGFCAIALAGGSTPRRLYQILAEGSAESGVPWNATHLFFGDERPVGPTHEDSNYRMAREALLDRVPLPESNVHRIEGEQSDSESAAALYELDLRAFFVSRMALLGAFPRFDLVLLGLGPDAHTASLFPGTTAVWEQHHWVTSCRVEKLAQDRITLTPPALNAARTLAFVVSGAEKAQAVASVMEESPDPGRLPAQIIRPKEGRLLWLLDRAAASGLEHR